MDENGDPEGEGAGAGPPAGEGDEQMSSDDEEQQFDVTLAATHSYMGPGLSEVGGRCILEAGWTGRVPARAHASVVFPGETVPMLLQHANDAAMITTALRGDKLFALLSPDESGSTISGYGALCEIYEAGVEGGAGDPSRPAAVTCKGRAIHRVRLRHWARKTPPVHLYSRVSMEEVVVLPEVSLADALSPLRLPGLSALTRHSELGANEPLSSGLRRNMARTLEALQSPWPRQIYDTFDFRRLRDVINRYFLTIGLSNHNMPTDPISLSHWVCSNLPLSARDRVALLRIDHALLRLLIVTKLIYRKSALCCTSCLAEISRRELALPMSSAGVHDNYTNLGGYMHDVLTVSACSGVSLSGAASREYSWFPGYQWTIAVCAACLQHVGWRFDALKRNLRPQQFFGLCRNYVQPRADSDAEEDSAMYSDVRDSDSDNTPSSHTPPPPL